MNTLVVLHNCNYNNILSWLPITKVISFTFISISISYCIISFGYWLSCTVITKYNFTISTLTLDSNGDSMAINSLSSSIAHSHKHINSRRYVISNNQIHDSPNPISKNLLIISYMG